MLSGHFGTAEGSVDPCNWRMKFLVSFSFTLASRNVLHRRLPGQSVKSRISTHDSVCNLANHEAFTTEAIFEGEGRSLTSFECCHRRLLTPDCQSTAATHTRSVSGPCRLRPADDWQSVLLLDVYSIHLCVGINGAACMDALLVTSPSSRMDTKTVGFVIVWPDCSLLRVKWPLARATKMRDSCVMWLMPIHCGKGLRGQSRMTFYPISRSKLAPCDVVTVCSLPTSAVDSILSTPRADSTRSSKRNEPTCGRKRCTTVFGCWNDATECKREVEKSPLSVLVMRDTKEWVQVVESQSPHHLSIKCDELKMCLHLRGRLGHHAKFKLEPKWVEKEAK